MVVRFRAKEVTVPCRRPHAALRGAGASRTCALPSVSNMRFKWINSSAFRRATRRRILLSRHAHHGPSTLSRRRTRVSCTVFEGATQRGVQAHTRPCACRKSEDHLTIHVSPAVHSAPRKGDTRRETRRAVVGSVRSQYPAHGQGISLSARRGNGGDKVFTSQQARQANQAERGHAVGGKREFLPWLLLAR
jgi:hypothetical protein